MNTVIVALREAAPNVEKEYCSPYGLLMDTAADQIETLDELLRWAYGKLHGRTFSSMDDALMADRIKLWLEHGIAG